MSIQHNDSRYMQQDFINYFMLISRNPIRVRTDVVPSTRNTSPNPFGRTYTAVEGEKYKDIAYDIYGQEHFWWAIADANPDIDLERGLFGLNAGEIIVIPDKSEFLL